MTTLSNPHTEWYAPSRLLVGFLRHVLSIRSKLYYETQTTQTGHTIRPGCAAIIKACTAPGPQQPHVLVTPLQARRVMATPRTSAKPMLAAFMLWQSFTVAHLDVPAYIWSSRTLHVGAHDTMFLVSSARPTGYSAWCESLDISVYWLSTLYFLLRYLLVLFTFFAVMGRSRTTAFRFLGS